MVIHDWRGRIAIGARKSRSALVTIGTSEVWVSALVAMSTPKSRRTFIAIDAREMRVCAVLTIWPPKHCGALFAIDAGKTGVSTRHLLGTTIGGMGVYKDTATFRIHTRFARGVDRASLMAGHLVSTTGYLCQNEYSQA